MRRNCPKSVTQDDLGGEMHRKTVEVVENLKSSVKELL